MGKLTKQDRHLNQIGPVARAKNSRLSAVKALESLERLRIELTYTADDGWHVHDHQGNRVADTSSLNTYNDAAEMAERVATALTLLPHVGVLLAAAEAMLDDLEAGKSRWRSSEHIHCDPRADDGSCCATATLRKAASLAREALQSS